jgi:hypothetical protein
VEVSSQCFLTLRWEDSEQQPTAQGMLSSDEVLGKAGQAKMGDTTFVT